MQEGLQLQGSGTSRPTLLGLRAMLAPAAKFDKQMKYANKRGLPYIIIAGEKEMAEGKLSLKNMGTGVQETMGLAEVVGELKKKNAPAVVTRKLMPRPNSLKNKDSKEKLSRETGQQLEDLQGQNS
ncbi:MAG: His/Gly/Thr/Pro-type tRNA ligase C-terminal domain-containing protein [Chitinophagaceae bacterium]